MGDKERWRQYLKDHPEQHRPKNQTQLVWADPWGTNPGTKFGEDEGVPRTISSPYEQALKTYGDPKVLADLLMSAELSYKQHGDKLWYGHRESLPSYNLDAWKSPVPVFDFGEAQISGGAYSVYQQRQRNPVVVLGKTESPKQSVLDHEMTHALTAAAPRDWRGEILSVGPGQPTNVAGAAVDDGLYNIYEEGATYAKNPGETVAYLTAANRAFYRKYGRLPHTTPERHEAIDMSFKTDSPGETKGTTDQLKSLPQLDKLMDMLVLHGPNTTKRAA